MPEIPDSLIFTLIGVIVGSLLTIAIELLKYGINKFKQNKYIDKEVTRLQHQALASVKIITENKQKYLQGSEESEAPIPYNIEYLNALLLNYLISLNDNQRTVIRALKETSDNYTKYYRELENVIRKQANKNSSIKYNININEYCGNIVRCSAIIHYLCRTMLENEKASTKIEAIDQEQEKLLDKAALTTGR